jgi:two-component system LytT family response regulator
MDSSIIAIKTARGTEFFPKEEILYCQARGRYTKIITTSGKEYMLTRVLKEIENCLSGEDFFRTHKSYLINLNHITHFQNNHEAPITLAHNVKILLAKRRKKDFHRKINNWVQTI